LGILGISPGDPDARPDARRRPLDNPRVLIAAAVLLIGLLAGLIWLSNTTTEIALPVLAEGVFYAMIGVCVTLLLALGFVLARNLLKLWVEQRRAAPFARFRAKLVAALLAMSIIPAVLVLITGSQVILNTAARWFSEPVDEIVSAASSIARTFYQDRKEALELRSSRLARVVPAPAVVAGDESGVANMVKDELATLRDGMIEIYRVTGGPGTLPDVVLVVAVESPTLPGAAPDEEGRRTKEMIRASADRIAARVVETSNPATTEDQLANGAGLLRSAAPIRGPDGAILGVVLVSQQLTPDLRGSARLVTSAFERYTSLRLLQVPIQAVYLSIFLAVTLLILISATWLGLYLAKRITRPVQRLAEGARAIGAGQFDVRLEAESGDELGSLVEAFNVMAAELRTSREKLEQSGRDLEHKNVEVEARRRYIETILERVATGVISLDAGGRISTVNGAAERLLALGPDAAGQPAREVFDREDLRPLNVLLDVIARREPGGVVDARREPRGLVEEITLAREDREVHLAAAATALAGEQGEIEGAVLVLDDVTPLIRAQRVAAWRDVARRLAHEIKNPLTPIQLSAERMRRHFATAPPPTVALVSECTDAIITEVEALKGLVDEFAQFARLRGPRLVPTSLNLLIDETLALYGGVLQQSRVRFNRQFATDLPAVKVDAEQIRQVVINLIDNALEALGGPVAPVRPSGAPPTIAIATSHDRRNGLVRIVGSDNGPGVPAADRDKLFMPYYSTKGRGSGLGLAIVRRIVVEHGGGIEAGEADPSGTVFTIELPAA
jgi:two-component system nitrogen regulation sensor histidine kinase NtrY